MAYFSIKCCDPSTRKLLLLIINILTFCWGAVHLGYAGSLSIVKIKSLQYLALSPLSTTTIFQIKQSSILTQGPLAYYVVTGLVALVASVIIILVVLQVVAKEDSGNRMFWFKLLAAMLVVNLLLEFGAAIYSTIMLSFYGLLFEVQINLSQDLIDAQLLQTAKDYYNGVRNFYRLSQAQVIVLWIFILPTIAMMIFALFQEFFKPQQPQQPTKIAPQRLQTEEKSKVYEKIQVESFGVEGFGANKSQEFLSLKK